MFHICPHALKMNASIMGRQEQHTYKSDTVHMQRMMNCIPMNISYVLRAWQYGIYEPKGPGL